MSFDSSLPVFGFLPNWGESLRERLEFRTDTLDSEDGHQQTRSTRLTPRRLFEFAVGAEGSERQLLHAQAYDVGAGDWYLPLWPDGQALSSTLASSSTTIAIDTTTRDYTAGGVVVLRGATYRDVVALEVESVSSGALALVDPVAQAWPIGTLVYPARKARIDGSFSGAAFTGRYGDGRLRFVISETNPWTAATFATTYRDYPVLTTRPHTARDPETDYARRIDVQDDDVGIPFIYDPVGIPLYRQQQDFWLNGRAALADFRAFAYALRGKRNSIWLPTWLNDLTLAAAATSDAVTIAVTWCGYTDYLFGVVNRKDIRIELTNGTVLYRRITAAVETSSTVETLTLDSALGVAIDPDTVMQISFMALCRSDSDIFEFDWWSGEFAEVATAWRSRQHDV